MQVCSGYLCTHLHVEQHQLLLLFSPRLLGALAVSRQPQLPLLVLAALVVGALLPPQAHEVEQEKIEPKGNEKKATKQ